MQNILNAIHLLLFAKDDSQPHQFIDLGWNKDAFEEAPEQP